MPPLAGDNSMANGVDDGDGMRVPLYHRIYLQMREKILAGEVPEDGRVATESEIAESYGVSRITASRALNELAAAGLVVRARGKGTRVNPVGVARAEPIVSSVEQLVERIRRMGAETSVRLVRCDFVQAPPRVAADLRIPSGSPVQRAVRLREISGEVFSHLTTHVPADLGERISAEEMASGPLIGLLEGLGIEIDRAEQTISATLADVTVAPLLGVEPGNPLMRIVRVVYDSTGRPVEHLVALYRPDRFQYHFSLSRVHSPRTGGHWHVDDAPSDMTGS